MGAWGSGVFENDCALDWVDDLESFSDLSLIVSTLEEALQDDLVVYQEVYVESAIVDFSMAAAETVAALMGHPAADLPQPLRQWVASNPLLVDEDTRELAVRVVERTLRRDELQKMWSEQADYDLWKQGVENLLARLQV